MGTVNLPCPQCKKTIWHGDVKELSNVKSWECKHCGLKFQATFKFDIYDKRMVGKWKNTTESMSTIENSTVTGDNELGEKEKTNPEISPENYRIIQRKDGTLAVLRHWKGFIGDNYRLSLGVQIHDPKWILLDPIKHAKKINEVVNSNKIPITSECDWISLYGKEKQNLPKVKTYKLGKLCVNVTDVFSKGDKILYSSIALILTVIIVSYNMGLWH